MKIKLYLFILFSALSGLAQEEVFYPNAIKKLENKVNVIRDILTVDQLKELCAVEKIDIPKQYLNYQPLKDEDGKKKIRIFKGYHLTKEEVNSMRFKWQGSIIIY
jgi:hypothetical protein